MILRSFLQEFFSDLERHNIRYVILRNYDMLPNAVGRDLDILFSEDDLCQYRIILIKVALKYGWRVIRIESRYGFFKAYLYHPNYTERRFVQIDGFYLMHWRGFPWISTDRVLANSIPNNGFYIPAPGYQAADLLLKELLASGCVKVNYRPRIVNFVKAEAVQFQQALTWAFGLETAKKLLELCSKQDWAEIESRVDEIRYKLVAHAWRTNLLVQLRHYLCFLWGHLNRYLHSTGFFIAFIGPDGSGKTSLSMELKNKLGKTVFNGASYYHGHFGIFPELKRVGFFFRWFIRKYNHIGLYSQRKHDDRIIKDIEPKDYIHPRMRAIGYLLYYTISYILGHLLVFHKRAQGALIICDRYFYDYMIQYSFLKLPKWLPRLLLPLIPSPDLTIFLANQPEVVRSRKQEIPIDEIQRQIDMCARLLPNLPNPCRVKTDIDLPKLTSNIIEIVVDRLGKKRDLS